VDLKMPELDGLQVIQRVRQIDPDLVIAVITGYATIATAVDAMKAGAYDFLPKPFTPDELRLIVSRGHERWRLAHESRRLQCEKEVAERRIVTFVSHQLKSPLVAAKQYLDVLLFTSRDDLIGPTAADWIVRAQARLEEMLALIDDWMDPGADRTGHARRAKRQRPRRGGRAGRSTRRPRGSRRRT
jgi:two-component system, sensor histidine kinase and response regulator